MEIFKETINKYSLIQKGDKILIGVSGGPDSVALLLGLDNLKSKLGLSLFIGHLDHGLRQDSKADSLFVQEWGRKLSIPVIIKKLNLKLNSKKGSREEIYREARLDFFIKTAKKLKNCKVALGHHQDDQAETVLMRLLRGAGLSGLSAIAVKRKIKNVTFIRPLLETSRREIESFLKRKKIKARIDSTNQEDIFFRNKLRHHLIPLLKNRYNQNIVQTLANLAECAAIDYEYLNQAAYASAKGNPLRLNIKKIINLHPAILRLKIRQSISHLQGDTRRINFAHIREIEDLLENRPKNSIVDLPKGISVQKTHNCLRFYKR